jgi:tetratricopeptide (TPR) repeat protein
MAACAAIRPFSTKMTQPESKNLSIGEALDMGAGYAMAGNHKSACEIYRGVMWHEPENFEAIERLGSSLFEMREYYEALYWFWRGRKLDRKHPMALTNYGLCLSQLEHAEEGLAALERAVYHAERMDTMSNEAKALCYNNLGNTFERLQRYPEALAALDRGIGYNPLDPFPHYNRGIVLLRLNRHQEAIAAIEHSIGLRPPALDSASRLNESDARYNLSMGYLLMGNLRDGFSNYEARLTSSENDTPNLNLPIEKKWKGEELKGKHIIVHCEQGLGDAIMFLRFLPDLIMCAGKVSLVAHTSLQDILRDWDWEQNITLLRGGDTLPEYDHWVAIMSLPLMLGIKNEKDLPPPWEPLLDAERTMLWQDRFRQMRGRRIGICWAGYFRHKNDRHRSVPLAVFANLFDAPVNFISLQQMREGETEEFAKLKKKHPNLSALWLDDWRDTAAVMRNLDLVISADTAVAHMAGSLGVPTWILIPKFGTDWRWGLEREDSPWYPSARLVRQDVIDDWTPTIKRILRDLHSAPIEVAA